METIIVSACLLGENTKYNGGDNYDSRIEKLKEKYADDKDFIKASQIIMQNINYYLDEMPALLLYIIKDEPETLSLKELKGYRALGADFSPLKKHINPNNKELLEALGIQL